MMHRIGTMPLYSKPIVIMTHCLLARFEVEKLVYIYISITFDNFRRTIQLLVKAPTSVNWRRFSLRFIEFGHDQFSKQMTIEHHHNRNGVKQCQVFR